MQAFYIAAGVTLLLVVLVVVSYNRFVRQRNLIEESWRQIDVELRRRYDLIPNLVETVQGYAAHERATLEAVTRARATAQAAAPTAGGGVAARAQGERQLVFTLRELLAVAEQYPNLKADDHFRQLQLQLAETEDRIAAGRRFYNGNVRAYNTRVETFPSSLIASLGNFGKAEYFEVEDASVRGPVSVRLGDGGPTG